MSDNLQHFVMEGSGPPIVFIHGFGLDHRMWENQMNFFSSHYKAIAIDLRGFGKSPPPSNQPFSYHEDIGELLDFLHIDQPIVLVGHSMGARAVANFVLTYPEKAKAVVFADGAIEGYIFKDFDLSEIYQTGRTHGIKAANQMWLDHPIFKSARRNPIVKKQLSEIIMDYNGWHWANKPSLKNPAIPAFDQLDHIKSPTLIITGQYDLSDFAILAEILHKKIVGSLKKEIAGAGHMCNMENPDEFNELVRQFLNSL